MEGAHAHGVDEESILSTAAVPSLDEFRARLLASGHRHERMVLDATGTMFEPRDEPTVDEVLDELPVLSGEESTQRDLRLKAPLGKGGMGQVVSAEQVALGRDVAVKRSLRGSKDRHAASMSLIQEGRATGALEHPNIVPVHALGKSPDGDVLLVMKRIDGTTWADLLRKRTSMHDGLTRHVTILIDVCRAVHFAHVKGILHRDIKPDNVMIGPFGEVYVVDWGLAVCFGDTSLPGVPHARDVRSASGTPAYMAPEMALPEGGLGPRSDVYLLGAVLHVVLTGKPPHAGATPEAMMFAAFESAAPTFDDDVPPELADICRRALARDAEARFASAEEMRVALEEFLAHASARLLCGEARARLTELERLVEARSDDDAAAQRAFSAARFGYETALRTWPESPDAKAGLTATLTSMALFEVQRRHLDAAAVLVGEIRAAPGSLIEKVEALRRELASDDAARAKNARIARSVDITTHRSRRRVIFAAVGACWFLWSLVSGHLQRTGAYEPSHLQIALSNWFLLVPLALFSGKFLRESGWDSRAGRGLIETTAVIIISAGTSWLASWMGGTPHYVAIAIGHSYLAVGIWIASVFTDRRLIWSAVPVALSLPFILAFPAVATEINGFGVACCSGLIAWLWRKPAAGSSTPGGTS
jgi:serine/threonine-protein kinase